MFTYICIYKFYTYIFITFIILYISPVFMYKFCQKEARYKRVYMVSLHVHEAQGQHKHKGKS